MVSILRIGDMCIKYQYHFDDYFDESIKQYEVSKQSYDYELLVELTSTFESFDFDWIIRKNRYHYISDDIEVITVYHNIEENLYSQQIVFNKKLKKAIIRLNPVYVENIATQEYVLSGVIFLEMAIMAGFIPIHASAINYQNQAILFSAPSTTGKSTQAKLWQHFNQDISIINDDKPLLFVKDNKFYVQGSPFSGKTSENMNVSIPLKTILFIKQSRINQIDLLNPTDALKEVIKNTQKPKDHQAYHILLTNIDKLIKDIPMYEYQVTKDITAVDYLYEKLFKKVSA
jgi:hypothetical protein